MPLTSLTLRNLHDSFCMHSPIDGCEYNSLLCLHSHIDGCEYNWTALWALISGLDIARILADSYIFLLNSRGFLRILWCTGGDVCIFNNIFTFFNLPVDNKVPAESGSVEPHLHRSKNSKIIASHKRNRSAWHREHRLR